MKAIIVKATGAQVQFGVNAPATKRNLEAVGVTIGLSTIKLIQNGTKTAACGIEVVEVVEKKEKAKRVSKVWEQFTTEMPVLNKLTEAGYTIRGTKIVGGRRFEIVRDGVAHYFNMGKRGVSYCNLNTMEKKTFPTIEDVVATFTA